MRNPESKILSREEAVAWRQSLKTEGRKLAVTNGCFDLLHRGHVEYLSRARETADALFVAVNNDASIRNIKGPSRPVISEDDRAYMLASLECVDAVVIFTEDKPLELLEAISPDIYVKGGDYTIDTIVQEERRLLEQLGVSFRFIPFVPGFSTTTIISRLQNSENN